MENPGNRKYIIVRNEREVEGANEYKFVYKSRENLREGERLVGVEDELTEGVIRDLGIENEERTDPNRALRVFRENRVFPPGNEGQILDENYREDKVAAGVPKLRDLAYMLLFIDKENILPQVTKVLDGNTPSEREINRRACEIFGEIVGLEDLEVETYDHLKEFIEAQKDEVKARLKEDLLYQAWKLLKVYSSI